LIGNLPEAAAKHRVLLDGFAAGDINEIAHQPPAGYVRTCFPIVADRDSAPV